MAILKHLAIKKKDYSDIQQYLIFKCEEGTHRPLRDETGHMIQRDFFIQSGMNCNAFTFDAECVKLNHQFHKNNHKGDIMAHHFIISFDPRTRRIMGSRRTRRMLWQRSLRNTSSPGIRP